MPFPFIPIGIVTGAAVLGGAFALIYLIVTRLDRAFSEVGGAVVGRLVAGFDDWSHERPPTLPTSEAGRRDEPMAVQPALDSPERAAVFEDAASVPVEPARSSRR
jgi:hypothetical protein